MKNVLIAFSFLFMSSQIFGQDCIEGQFTMVTQPFGNEIEWNITDIYGNTFYSSQSYSDYSTTIETVCLYPDCYFLNLVDSYGDGWNGANLEYTDSQGVSTFYTLPSGSFSSVQFMYENNNACDSTFIVYGCTDTIALNYSPYATIDDGSCYYEQEIYGCMDSTATNYNPFATIDNGSCNYSAECENGSSAELYVCTFSNGSEVGLDIIGDNGDTVFSQYGFNDVTIEYINICLEDSACYTAYMSNSAGPFGWYNGYFWVNGMGVQYVQDALMPGEQFGSVTFSIDGTCGEVFGCTDSTAVNYNPLATSSDGSCIYPSLNDLCSEAYSIEPGVYEVNNSGAVLNENIWGECWNSGSGEGEQTSVWYSFTTPDTPDFRLSLESMGDNSYSLTDTQFGLFEECGAPMIACDGNGGDGLFSRLEFECGELAPNTTYILVIDGWYGDSGTCLLSYEVDYSCEDQVLGCTDPEALNYNPFANVNDGSCVYLTDSCEYNSFSAYLTTQQWGYEISFNITDDNGYVIYSGTGFDSFSEYALSFCLEDGCYTIELMDSYGDGWNGGSVTLYWNGLVFMEDLTLDVGEYTYFDFGVNADCDSIDVVFGCMDPNALNYNPSATIDDGSCVYDDPICEASWELVDIDEEGGVVYLMNTSYGENLTYFWDFGDGNYSNEAFPTHQYLEDGLYLICLTVMEEDSIDNFCYSAYCDTISYYTNPGVGGTSNSPGSTGGFWLNVSESNVLGVADVELMDFVIYPVPADDVIRLDMKSVSEESLNIRIMDMSGKLVGQRNNTSFRADGSLLLDVGHLTQGTYILDIQGGSVRGVKRFTILR